MNYRWYITTICILALKLSRPSSSRPRIVGAIAFGASLQSCTANPTWHFPLRKFATWERINSNWTQHWIDEHPHMKHFRFVVGFLIRVGFHEKPGQGMPPARKLHHGEFDATISGEEASKLSCDDGDAIFFSDEHICENDLRKFGVRAVFEPSFFLRSLMIKSLGTYSWFPLWCLIDQWTLIWPTEWTRPTRHCHARLKQAQVISHMCFTFFSDFWRGVDCRPFFFSVPWPKNDPSLWPSEVRCNKLHRKPLSSGRLPWNLVTPRSHVFWYSMVLSCWSFGLIDLVTRSSIAKSSKSNISLSFRKSINR